MTVLSLLLQSLSISAFLGFLCYLFLLEIIQGRGPGGPPPLLLDQNETQRAYYGVGAYLRNYTKYLVVKPTICQCNINARECKTISGLFWSTNISVKHVINILLSECERKIHRRVSVLHSCFDLELKHKQ